MFRQFDIEIDYDGLKKMVYKTPALNYFICMSFEASLSVYKTILISEDESGEIILGVFHRKSGNLQIALNPDYDFEADTNKVLFTSLRAYLTQMDYKTLIIPKTLFMKIEKGIPYRQARTGAEIEKLVRREPYALSRLKEGAKGCVPLDKIRCEKLEADDLNQVEAVYKLVFKGHPSEDYMRAKLDMKRGRAYGIWLDGKLVSVAQTDFFDEVIVGVATLPDYQGCGFSRFCLQTLINSILPEPYVFYLQVENPIAINLYHSLGFERVDQILHVTN